MSELINQILESIRLETKKNPLTDLELSKILNCERAYVTKVRRRNKIPSRNERYKKYLMEEIVEAGTLKEDLDEDQMIKLLNEKGYTLTRYMAKELLKDIRKSRNVKTTKMDVGEKSGFEELVGAEGSLKNAIRLAKSAIVFPGKGLPSLLVGERGVGKWTVAKLMYQYGKSIGKFHHSMEFQDIHCADYKENTEEIKSLLKNSLNTVEQNEEKGQKLFLFLEDVDLLPIGCKEILFEYLESYNNSDSKKTAPVFLVGSTTKSYAQSQENRLLSSFPIKIQIPDLESRSLEERLELISVYLKKQSKKLDRSIVIDKDALTAFLLYQPKGNVNGLLADLQTSMARSFTSGLVLKNDALYVDLDSIGEDVKKGFLQSNVNREKTHSIIPAQGLRIDRYGEPVHGTDKKEYPESNIHDLINREYVKHQKEEHSKAETRDHLGRRIEEIISNDLMDKNGSKTTLEEIQHVVGEKLVQAMQKSMEHTTVLFPSYTQRLFHSLVLHVGETMKRIRQGRKLVIPDLDYVPGTYPAEYQVSLKMMDTLEKTLKFHFPKEEAAYIALYLKGFVDPSLEMSQIGILVITHGNYGSKMVDMAKQLMRATDARIKTIEMSLDQEMGDIYEDAVELVQELDQGKGVLIMVDMGSLNALTPMITQETGVSIAGVDRIDILLLMEAIRMCSRPGMSIHELKRLMTDLKSGFFGEQNYRKQGFHIKKMIITTCLTGEGSALFLKQQLGKYLKDQDVEILALGVFSTQGLFEKIMQLKKTYDILFITGTIDPKVPDIDFVFLDDIIKKETFEKIKRKYLSFKSKERLLKMDKSILFVNGKFKDKLEVVAYLCRKVAEYGYTNENYINSVLERMALAPLNMLDGSEKGIVVIHTASFDEVIKPGLAVLTLSEPIFWDHIFVDVIFVLLVKDSSIQIPMEFHTSIVTNERIMNNIRAARNKNELYELLNRRGPT